MTATEQVRADLALRMSRFPIIEAPAMCEVIKLDSVRNLLARRAALANERKFSFEPVALTGWSDL